MGGLATQYSAIQWRGIYAAFAGIGGLGAILVIATCPPSPKRHIPGGVDYIGAALITASLTLIIFCLAQGPAVGWSTSYVIALLVIVSLDSRRRAAWLKLMPPFDRVSYSSVSLSRTSSGSSAEARHPCFACLTLRGVATSP